MRFRVAPFLLLGLVWAAGRAADLPTVSPDGVWGASSETAASPAPTSEKNQLTYVGYQTLLSTYVYGLSFPLAFGADNPRVLIAVPLITAPLAFGAHLWISRQVDFTDAHLKGTSYVPTLSTYAATALPLAFTHNFGDGYKTGAILGALAYPLGLWYGYHLGNVYRSDPEQLDTKAKFALGYGFLGFITPALYFQRPGDHSDDIVHVGLGQSAGFALLGFAVADFYRTGPEVPSGVPLGISTHTLLGGLAGLEFAALADASSARPWIGAAVLGSSLGFTEGVFFFYPSHDSEERSLYSLLGGLGGTLMGAGLQLLLYDKHASPSAQKAEWSSYLIGGTWLGYWTTYLLTMGMVDAPRKHAGVVPDEKAEPMRWAVNPLPAAEPVMSRGDLSWRWRIPGVSYRF